MCAVSPERAWLRAASVDEAIEALSSHKKARVVSGATSKGIYQHADRAATHAAEAAGEQELLVDIGALSELAQVKLDGDALVVGGAAPLRALIDALESNAQKSPATFAAIAGIFHFLFLMRLLLMVSLINSNLDNNSSCSQNCQRSRSSCWNCCGQLGSCSFAWLLERFGNFVLSC